MRSHSHELAPPRTRPAPAFLLLAVLLPSAADARETPPEEEVLVVGHESVPLAVPGPDSSLRGEDLRRRVRSTLGQTLENEPGVHNASFGPGVGVPIIRGLGGTRVRMMQNGLGSHDVSSMSPDHAVTVETLLAEEIRVRRSTDALRSGGSASAGAVEVIDHRIPEVPAERPLGGAVEARYGNNPDGHAEVVKLDLGYEYLAAHVDGFHRRAGNVAIPGGALDTAGVLAQFGDTIVFEDANGKLLNSDTQSHGGSLGASVVGDDGYAGIAISSLDNEYGIPPGGLPPHSDVPGVAPETQNIRIDIAQTRRDFRSELRFGETWVRALRSQVGIIDYRHHEQDRGFVSTTFRNDVIEARAEADLAFSEALPTTLGTQIIRRDFSAIGLESYVPATEIGSEGVFLIQKLALDALDLEAGVRYERNRVASLERTRRIGDVVEVQLPAELNYTAWSGVAAATVALGESFDLRFDYSYVERPPEVQELLALGAHLATRTFDVGNIALANERSHAFELGAVWSLDFATLELDAFHRRFGGFVYQENQGFFFDIDEQLFRIACARLDQCLPVLGYRQQDARFNGFEANLAIPLPLAALEEFTLSVFTDYVRAYFTAPGAGDVPRLPPLSYGAALEVAHGGWRGGLRVSHALAQDRPGLNETATDGYVALGFDLAWRVPLGNARAAEVFVQGRNLLDEEIRNSTSFLRLFMPEEGRGFEAGLRLEF